jgi:hypothetical protein
MLFASTQYVEIRAHITSEVAATVDSSGVASVMFAPAAAATNATCARPAPVGPE